MKKFVSIALLLLCSFLSVACGEPTPTAPEIPGHTHTYTEKVISIGSCTKKGSSLYSCACGYTYEGESSTSTLSATDIHTFSVKSVGEVVTKDKSGQALSLGSCFVYESSGKIVTNYHVIDGAYSADVTIDGVKYPVTQVLAYDKEIDLAVLQISARNLSALNICKLSHAVGSTVYAFGSSQGLTATFSQGIITYMNREIDDVYYVQHDAAISSGNSGGPLINEYGEIIGINTMSVNDSQNLNFAISAVELNNLSFSSPLTFSEFYEKECSVFKRIMNFVKEKGTYSSKYNNYEYTLGYKYSSDYSSKYTRLVSYDIEDNYLTFTFKIDSSNIFFFNVHDTVDGSYAWGYLDSYDNLMIGTLYAAYHTSSSTLYPSDHNITSSNLLTSAKKLATSMLNLYLTYFDTDFASIDVTTKSLGFTSF